jgi:hypothetical protein
LFQHGVVALLGFGRRDVADGLQEPSVVEPIHPFQGRELDGLEAARGNDLERLPPALIMGTSPPRGTALTTQTVSDDDQRPGPLAALARVKCPPLPGPFFARQAIRLEGRRLVGWIRRTKSKAKSKEEPQPARDLEERRQVLEEYIADLRAFLDKLRRKLS